MGSCGSALTVVAANRGVGHTGEGIALLPVRDDLPLCVETWVGGGA